MNAAGKPSAITDQLNTGTTYFSYDFSSGPSNVQDPLGNATKVARDVLGRLSSITAPLRNTVQFPSYYSDEDLLSKVTDAMGNSTTLSFDGLDNFIGWTDAAGNSTTIASVAGTLEIKSGTGGAEQYFLDPVGNVTGYTDKRDRPARLPTIR